MDLPLPLRWGGDEPAIEPGRAVSRERQGGL